MVHPLSKSPDFNRSLILFPDNQILLRLDSAVIKTIYFRIA